MHRPSLASFVVVAATATAFVACKPKIDGLSLENGKVAPEAIDVGLEFTSNAIGQPPPADFTAMLVVKDDGKEVCSASVTAASGTVVDFPHNHHIDFHAPAKCPPRAPTASRYIYADANVAGGEKFSGQTLVTSAPASASAANVEIGSLPTPAIAVETKRANFIKALAAMPSPAAASKPCSDDTYRGLPRVERVHLHTVLYEDALRKMSIPGAKPAALGSCDDLLEDADRSIALSTRLLMVMRADACTAPVVDLMKQTYKGGSFSGVAAIVDLTDGTIACSTHFTAVSSKRVATEGLAHLDVRGDFAARIYDAAHVAFHPLSRFVESDPDPRMDPKGNSPW